MVHQKNLKSSNDTARWTRAPAPGDGTAPASPTAAPERRLPALPPPPPTVWPWWAHMDPSYPDALLAFLEMRLRCKYLQDRRPQRCLINDGTQTDDVAWPPVDSHSSSLLQSPKHLTSETVEAHCSCPLQSPKHLTSEPTDAHSSRPLQSPKHLTSESADAHSSRPLQSPKHPTSELSKAQSSILLEGLKDLTSEPADVHTSSPKHLISDLADAHSSRLLETRKHFTNETTNAQSSGPLESPKHVTIEPANTHSLRTLETPKQHTNDLTNAHNSRPLECLKHLTSELADTSSSRLLESLKHLTAEMVDFHSSRPLESPKYLPRGLSDIHSSKLLESLKQLTTELTKPHSSRTRESPKYLTSKSTSDHSSRPLESPKHLASELANGHSSRPGESSHLTSERPQSGTQRQHDIRLTTDLSDQLRDAQHSSSSSQEDGKTISNRKTSSYSHSALNTHFTPNHQTLVQNSVANTIIGGQSQETHSSPFATPRMEAAQSRSVALSSHFSTTRTFSMRGGEWYVEEESSMSKVNPDVEANRNYASADRNIENTDRILVSKALNPKPQNIFQKLFRFRSKSSINSDSSTKCSLPFDGESTAREDFNLGNATCNIPTENTCKRDFLKVNKDLLIYTFKETDKGIFNPDWSRGRRHRNHHHYIIDRAPHRRSKYLDELRCIYFNRAASFSSLADDLFDESDSSSSEINLFFTTMNFQTAFSDGESSSGSASSSYSPRRTKDREECIDLRNALASEAESQLIEKTEDVPRQHTAQVPVSRTRCQHSSVRPLSFDNEQHANVSTVTKSSAATVANYCEIHDSTRERFEVEFLKSAVSKLFDMNPEQLKDDIKNFPVLLEPTSTSASSASRRSPARSPRTSRNINRKTIQSKAKETNEGVFARAWRNVVRLVQRKAERTEESSQRPSCATLTSGKSGTKASEVKDRDSNPDGSFTPRVATLSPIDEVPETTTSGSSALGTGKSSSELITSNRRKM